MGPSCLIFAFLCGTAALIFIPLAICLCLCCIGFTASWIRTGLDVIGLFSRDRHRVPQKNHDQDLYPNLDPDQDLAQPWIKDGSADVECMASGEGKNPACVSCGYPVGATDLPVSILVAIFLIPIVIGLYNCQSAANFYCRSLVTDESRCFYPRGIKEAPCFTFFGKEYCEEEFKDSTTTSLPTFPTIPGLCPPSAEFLAMRWKCPRPNAPFGMIVEFPEDMVNPSMKLFPVGAVATFRCPRVGSHIPLQISRCQEDGTWEHILELTTNFCNNRQSTTEEQNGCAYFEHLIMGRKGEHTCINTNFKYVHPLFDNRCQCKQGLVRALSTGKCIKPELCPESDQKDTSKRYEEFDIACNGEKVYYNYDDNNYGFCEVGLFRTIEGDCVKKEDCPSNWEWQNGMESTSKNNLLLLSLVILYHECFY